jgi:hypothetical protein
MDLEELRRKVIELRDARDWEQLERQRAEVRAAEVRGLKINGKKYPADKA